MGSRMIVVTALLVFAVLCLAQPAASYDDDLTAEYSVTTLDDYHYINDFDPPYGANYVYPKTKYWLHDVVSWSEEFYWYNNSVWQTDFGTQTSGYKGLDEADYHIHFGHGGKA